MECLNEVLIHAILQNDLKRIKTYLKRGININKICSGGMTLLGVAVQTGNLTIVKTLIEHSNYIEFTQTPPTATTTTTTTARNNLQLDLTTDRHYRNIGYFVVNREIDDIDFGDGPTPEGMDGLEWDMEINQNNDVDDDDDDRRIVDENCKSNKQTDINNIYQWYASILNRSSIVLRSPDNDIARLDSHGENVLHYAVRSGNIEMVKYLMDTFNELNVNQTDAAQFSPLHLAVLKCHINLVRYLIDRGANINSVCRERRTPLHLAAHHGYIEIMQILIENDADINVYDMKERTPLALAVLNSRDKAVELLIENGARLNQEDATGFTPLRRAVWNDSATITILLLNAGARIIQSHYLLHTAVRSNNVEMVRALHNAGALLNIRDDQGQTPLMVACSRKNITVVKYLLKYGANVNTINNINGMTALHICVQDIRDKRSLELLIDLLISYGADMNITSYQGNVLFYSIILENIHGAIQLVRHGCNVNKRDERAYFDMLSLAKRHGNLELVKTIVYAGFQFSNMVFNLKSLKTHPDDQVYDFLINVKRSPLNLRELCRIVIRKQLGQFLISKIRQLPLPGMLQQYLALEII